jgi:group I intron endonuclease
MKGEDIMVGIYKMTNKINGKVYIGQSIDINKRIKEHFWKATNEKDVSYNSAIHQAIRKYGAENFDWEILEECNADVIDEKEVQYI